MHIEEFFTAKEAMQRFGARKDHLSSLRQRKRARRAGWFAWRYPKRELLREILAGGHGDSQEPVPVVRLANTLLTQAIDTGALRADLVPGDAEMLVSFRESDAPAIRIPSKVATQVTARMKDMAELKLDITNQEQLGVIRLRHHGQSWICQVTVTPTHFGERVQLDLHQKEEYGT